MEILGFLKTTLLDYPGKVACTVFTGGCNFRCPFCHNGDLVLSPEKVPAFSLEEFFSHLKKRSGILEGVCITGGEPTLSPDLPELARRIHSLGLAVKIDTNGYQPAVLETLAAEGLVDYVAMDIKHCPEKYNFISQRRDFDIGRIRDSVSFLRNGNIPYEFRTTIVKELHNKGDFADIGSWLKGGSHYFLQPYNSSKQVITPGFSSYSYEEMNEFVDILRPFLPNTAIRGMDEAHKRNGGFR